MDDFEVIDIVDNTSPYPTLLGWIGILITSYYQLEDKKDDI
jgi:hypothetical protein